MYFGICLYAYINFVEFLTDLDSMFMAAAG